MSFKIEKIFVIGGGQMGLGIAQVFASAGLKSQIYDKDEQQLSKAKVVIDKSLAKFVEKGKISEEVKKQIISDISYVNNLPEKIDAQLVIEAVIENTEIKKQIFSEVSKSVEKSTILASNTSSLSITKIASSVVNPDRFIGMHFMNPVPLMELVEIIRGLQTSDETHQSIVEVSKKIGKIPITALKDQPGFIVNRILVPMINEAFFTLMEGIATPEDIDLAMKLGTNQPMGPLELADFVGLDTCLFICETFHRELGEDKYRPCPLLRKYVEAGWLGRKVGRGVYKY